MYFGLQGISSRAKPTLKLIRVILLATVLQSVLTGCTGVTATPTPLPQPLVSATPQSANPTGSAISSTAPSPTDTPYLPPEHRIGIRQVDGISEFFNRQTGEKFIPRGANYVFVPHAGAITNFPLKVGVYNPERTRQDFGILASLGYNTVRVFLDQCSAGPGCIGASDNQGLNPAYLDNIADMLAAATATGILILFTSNDLPDQGGYAEQANAQQGPIFAGYRNSYYLTPGAVLATRRYWHDLLAGLNARQAATDSVLGWQLLNEQWMFIDQPPLSLNSGLVTTTTGIYDMSDPTQKKIMVSDGLIHYIMEVKSEILALDPTALLTMGFFAPEIAAPGWYVETASLLENADLDFFDFHAYPGGPDFSAYVEAFGMADYNRKPIILGEYGAFRHIFASIRPAARAITAWQAESCKYGFDGWLYWTYFAADPAISDRTWGLLDESNFLLNLLAPASHPDPCEQVRIQSDNLAYQKNIRASASLADEPPANGNDENASSQWGAGADAPQWLEIDLGQPYRITEIRLLVAQWPAGLTTHRIRGRLAAGSFTDLFTFEQNTQEGDWLIFSPEKPLDGIQILRIETLRSPSWVAWSEIEVYGE